MRSARGATSEPEHHASDRARRNSFGGLRVFGHLDIQFAMTLCPHCLQYLPECACISCVGFLPAQETLGINPAVNAIRETGVRFLDGRNFANRVSDCRDALKRFAKSLCKNADDAEDFAHIRRSAKRVSEMEEEQGIDVRFVEKVFPGR